MMMDPWEEQRRKLFEEHSPQVQAWCSDGVSRGRVIMWLQTDSRLSGQDARTLVNEVYGRCSQGLILFNNSELSEDQGYLITLGAAVRESKCNVIAVNRVVVTEDLVENMYFGGRTIPEGERSDFEVRAYSLVGKVAYGVVVEGACSFVHIENALPNNGPACRDFVEGVLWHKPFGNEEEAVAIFEALPEVLTDPPVRDLGPVGSMIFLVGLVAFGFMLGWVFSHLV